MILTAVTTGDVNNDYDKKKIITLSHDYFLNLEHTRLLK